MTDDELIGKFFKTTEQASKVSTVSQEATYANLYEEISKEQEALYERYQKEHEQRLREMEDYYNNYIDSLERTYREEPVEVYAETNIDSTEIAKGFVLGNFLWKVLCFIPKLLVGLALLLFMFTN